MGLLNCFKIIIKVSILVVLKKFLQFNKPLHHVSAAHIYQK